MREILFRAKTVKNVHWIWGDLFRAGTEPSDGEFAISYWDDEDGWMNENVQPGTIGQFTGLLDKHGKRVFEGDILRVKEYKNLCWDLSKSREERDEMMRTFALEDLKGELDKEYISAVAVEEGTYCLSSNGDYNDMYLSCLFGDMNGSLPIFDFEVIGNIHDDPKLHQSCGGSKLFTLHSSLFTSAKPTVNPRTSFISNKGGTFISNEATAFISNQVF